MSKKPSVTKKQATPAPARKQTLVTPPKWLTDQKNAAAAKAAAKTTAKKKEVAPPVAKQKDKPVVTAKPTAAKKVSAKATAPAAGAQAEVPALAAASHALLSQLTSLQSSPDMRLIPGAVQTAMQQAGATASNLWLVPVDRIRIIQGFNVRMDTERYRQHVRQLADFMKVDGAKADKPLTGIVAQEGEELVIYVTSGHSRLQAAQLAIAEGAQIPTLPVVVRTGEMDLADITASLQTDNDGKPLDVLEKAMVCKRLRTEHGWDDAKICAKLGFTRQYLRDMFALLEAPLKLRELVATDRIAAATAVQTIYTHGDKALDIILKALAEAEGSGKDKVTKSMIPGTKAKLIRSAAPRIYDVVTALRSDPAYARLAPELQKKLDDLVESIERESREALGNAKPGAVTDGPAGEAEPVTPESVNEIMGK